MKEVIGLMTLTALLHLGGMTYAQNIPLGDSGPLTTNVKRDTYPDGSFKWTPRDSVQVRYFVTDQSDSSWSYATGDGAVVPSPNGEHFFFLSDRGDLESDCRIFELSVFAVQSVVQALHGSQQQPLRPPAPLRTVSMSNQNPSIAAADWDGDSAGIVFFGLNGKNTQQQLYRLDLKSGDLTALTNDPNGIRMYWRKHQGLIYDSVVDIEPPPESYPFFTVTQRDLTRAVFRESNFRLDTFVSYAGRKAWQLNLGWYRDGGPWFSPDGRRAIMIRLPVEVPASWKTYDGTEQFGTGAPQRLLPAEFPQFTWIDLENERGSPMLDAPTGEAIRVGEVRTRPMGQARLKLPPTAIWSHDSKRVVLVNAALPLAQLDSNPDLARMAYIVDFEVETRNWKVLEPLQSEESGTVKAVGWVKPGREFVVQHEKGGKPASSTLYSLGRGGWIARTVNTPVQIAAPTAVPRRLSHDLSVELRQSANEPPIVVASKAGRQVALTSPDPALEGVRLTSMEPFQWKDSKGETHTGGVLMPGEKGAPLVIQVGHYMPDQFRPDGPFSVAYAAQVLAAKGMAVLNLTFPQPPLSGTPRETAEFLDWAETAAMALQKEHSIDLDKVGLIGFSRSGYLIYHAITHPRRIRFGGAVIADSVKGTYPEYLLGYATGFGVPRNWDVVYGGRFYDSKSTWIENETSFNVDRVETPVLFADNSRSQIGRALHTIGAFMANNRPFDYLIFPDGSHQLETPRQRFASIEASVDWMSFWLQEETPSDPDRAARWAVLRQQQAQVLSRP